MTNEEADIMGRMLAFDVDKFEKDSNHQYIMSNLLYFKLNQHKDPIHLISILKIESQFSIISKLKRSFDMVKDDYTAEDLVKFTQLISEFIESDEYNDYRMTDIPPDTISDVARNFLVRKEKELLESNIAEVKIKIKRSKI